MIIITITTFFMFIALNSYMHSLIRIVSNKLFLWVLNCLKMFIILQRAHNKNHFILTVLNINVLCFTRESTKAKCKSRDNVLKSPSFISNLHF